MELVSVIVPIYNNEKYLSACIDSIIGQTYKNIEIILVDDGSVDDSGNILDSYAYYDSRIQVFHNENHGVGYSRNYGIKKACGKYIVFIDSDDICDLHMIEVLVCSANQNDSDLVICGLTYFNYDTDIPSRKVLFPSGNLSFSEYVQKILLNMRTSEYCGGPYAKLYRTDIIKNSNIFFDEGKTYGEDFCFNMNYLCTEYVFKISLVDETLYHYRENSSNSLSAQNYLHMNSEVFWNQRKDVIISYERVFYKLGIYQQYRKLINILFVKLIISTIKQICKYDDNAREMMQNIIDDSFSKNHCFDTSGLKFSEKIRWMLIRHNQCDLIYILEKTRYVIGGILKNESFLYPKKFYINKNQKS